MSLPEGTPGSRFTYQIEITAREKEACERAFAAVTSAGPNALIVIGDNALVSDVLRKIALLPKKVVAESKSEE